MEIQVESKVLQEKIVAALIVPFVNKQGSEIIGVSHSIASIFSFKGERPSERIAGREKKV
jgi:hypothetical protein